MKVLAAMSGGVDSSVTAARLQRDGHEVVGATLLLHDSGGAEAAAEVARHLGITHHVFDLRELFTQEIIEEFCREYARGRTPNPCVRCNERIKFGALLAKAQELGADYVATGHYARIAKGEDKHLLRKGADAAKDQSYFLCRLSSEQLARALFPVGGLTKPQVRELAAALELPAAERPESQEICFVPDNDYAAFLKERLPLAAAPGPILDEHGNTIGQHRGITAYTVGQRQGLGIAAPTPLYVTAIDAARNAVIVGGKEAVYGNELVADELNWTGIEAPQSPIKIKAKIRYRHPEAEATVTPIDNNEVYVKFIEPQLAITPGQTIAFYDGDIVIGGGTINRQGR